MYCIKIHNKKKLNYKSILFSMHINRFDHSLFQLWFTFNSLHTLWSYRNLCFRLYAHANNINARTHSIFILSLIYVSCNTSLQSSHIYVVVLAYQMKNKCFSLLCLLVRARSLQYRVAYKKICVCMLHTSAARLNTPHLHNARIVNL